MARLAVLHHLEEASTGLAGPILEAAGVELDERDLPRGDPLPRLDEVDGVLSLGGRQSVREIERYPYLGAELELMREAVGRRTPLLGICLGGQLLARAHGGRIGRLEQERIGWPRVRRLAEADGDPLFGAVPGEIAALHWNEDYFTVPGRADELLERSAAGGEAFRIGDRAWGVQFHPEAGPDLLDEWYRRGRDRLAELGLAEAEARAADAENMAAQRSLAETLFGAFADTVAGR